LPILPTQDNEATPPFDTFNLNQEIKLIESQPIELQPASNGEINISEEIASNQQENTNEQDNNIKQENENLIPLYVNLFSSDMVRTERPKCLFCVVERFDLPPSNKSIIKYNFIAERIEIPIPIPLTNGVVDVDGISIVITSASLWFVWKAIIAQIIKLLSNV
jgi:hypothetical protein